MATLGKLLKGDFNKKMFWIIFVVVVIVSSFVLYPLVDRWQYQYGFRELPLELVYINDFVMTEKVCYWLTVTTQDQAKSIEASHNIVLPDIDFEKQMLLLSYGSELERFCYNLKEKTYNSRGKYIGFSYFKNEIPSNILCIYSTDKVPLMNTDEAGYPPNYKGKY